MDDYCNVPGQQTPKKSVLWQKCIVGHEFVAEQFTRPAEVDRGAPSPPQGSVAAKMVDVYTHVDKRRDGRGGREREREREIGSGRE